MSFERKEYAGAAPATTLAAGIDSDDLTIALASGTGHPSGSVGPFVEVIGRSLPNEEKVLCESRSSGTVTVLERGYDGTSAGSHATGEPVEHCASAVDLDEANQHITNTNLDHHVQYHNATRHAAVSHTAAMLASDSVTSGKIQDGAVVAAKIGAGAVITSKLAADAVTGAQIADDAVDSEHIADDAIENAHIADGAVVAATIGAGAVITSKLAADAVTGAQIADDAVDSEHYVDGSIDTAHIADTAVTNAKVAAEAWVAFTPTLNGWTIGNGSIAGRRQIRGKTVHWWAKLTFGSSTNVSVGGGISPPGTLASADFSGTAKYRDDSTGNVHLGAWHNSSASVIVCKTTDNDGQANVSATAPFTWATADSVTVTGTAELA